jgi:hypothetical protein
MSIAFVACVEPGILEDQTMLLCRSIRRYGGRYAGTPIYTFQPRRGPGISAATLRAFENLRVTHIAELLNADFDDYAVGNKVFVCARAEERLSEETLVFFDSDTILTGEPADLVLGDEIDAAVRPADSVLNSTGPGHQNEDYWRRVWDHFGLSHHPFVETELGRRVRAYFSSGLVAVRRAAGLFSQWKADFLRIADLQCFPNAKVVGEAAGGVKRLDEISLAVTLVRSFDRLLLLDDRYNYLIYRRPSLKKPWGEAQLDQLVHVHYRYWFNMPNFLRLIRPSLDPSREIIRWLEEYLPFEPTICRPVPE